MAFQSILRDVEKLFHPAFTKIPSPQRHEAWKPVPQDVKGNPSWDLCRRELVGSEPAQ